MSYDDGMPAGGNSRFRGYPARMSERQQLALLLQMTSQEIVSEHIIDGQTMLGGNRTENTTTSSTTPRSSTLQQRGSKGRWTSKNGESAVQASINRKEDFRVRQMLVNGYDLNAKETNNITGVKRAQQRRQTSKSRSNNNNNNSFTNITILSSNNSNVRPEVHQPLHSTLLKTVEPPVRCGGHHRKIKEKQCLQNQGQMENSSKTSNVSSGTVNAASGSATTGNTSSATDSGDVYEFKSSKEPTPVRGASSSPNPNPEKDKDGSKPGSNQGGQNGGNNVSTVGSTTSSGETTTSSISSDDAPTVSASPSSKRAFESDNTEEQDEENRRKKRKDSEPVKENLKSTTTGRQSAGRNSANTGEKCTKSTKQGSGATSGKNNQNAVSIAADRKSPSASSVASSPKPSNPSSSTTNTKTTTPAPAESDGEDDRSKGSDSNSAPKVPPLKIVIPQSTTSEQEQGNRNGKSTSNRSHQLPYVVASSNSNDSTDKDQSQSASGTTSPTEGGNNTKNEDKKDFSGALHGEERSTHHQRVLRSSHRSGNGNNGSANLKETSTSAGNGNYSNSSPLPVTTTDRSNNSSPQQRHHSPTPETTGSESNKNNSTEVSNSSTTSKTNVAAEKSEKNTETGGKCQKDGGVENSENTSTTTSSTTSNVSTPAPPVELHPRKRKMKPNKEAQQAATAASNETSEATNTGPEVHPHDQPITNCYQLFLNIRKQIERRRKGLFPVQPKPPQGFKDYLMNRCTYVLAGNANKEPNVNPPVGLQGAMKDLYIEQEKERYRLRMQHVVEKEKLVLSVEQEILRVHGRAARALANQSLPFSVCTILKDEEVYNVITPEQEEKDRNARSRYNGRLFLSWLQDVDDKWEKIKEAMLLRHHNEAESLHAVQRMDWEWKLKEVGLCEFKATPQIEDIHVPMVHVSDDFDLLPA
nr:PREDICTED: ankyrin repeat domain-containing protein 11 isoform X6 [Megachile rotundata]